MRSMQAFIKDLPFYIIRLWSFYVQYFPPTFTDSWRRARLLPVALESLAHSTPNRVYACIPRSEDVKKDGFRDVTYKQLLNAVDAAAWWLDSEDVFSNERGQVFTYVGPRDLRYAILLLASIKTGRVLFLMSPHMPPHTQACLFSQIDCGSVLYDSSVKDRAEASKDAIPGLRTFECPSQAAWIDGEEPRPYIYEPSWDQAKDVLVAIFHTSGSTTIPKPVKYTHAAFVCYDSMYRLLAPPFADKKMEGQKFYTMFPPMHTGGLTVSLLVPLYRHTVFVSGLPTLDSPSPSSVHTILRVARPDAALLTPYVISSLLNADYNGDSTSEQDSSLLTIPSSIGFAGSSLPKYIGDTVCQRVVLRNGYGSTEAGHFSQFPYSRSTWEYLSFHPLLGVEFVPYNYENDPAVSGSSPARNEERGEQEVYHELVIRPHSDPTQRSDFQIIFHTQPELLTSATSQPASNHFTSDIPSQESEPVYHSSDLWTPHPSIRGLWKWVGRTDDMISLSNGGKVFACAVEDAIKRAYEDDEMKEAGSNVGRIQVEVLLGGHGFSSPFLLVEFTRMERSIVKVLPEDEDPASSRPFQSEELNQLIVRLRRTVRAVNATNTLTSRHTQIDADRRVICLDGNRQRLEFVRTEKGSLQRKKTFEKYDDVVKATYSVKD
ncbi:hypothetical protein C8R42DRAFT_773070 [Lentinula raphanica]|nr:hypothetical protein C8R42DRAFT_773070 [Lentinula raphanica]